MAAGDALFAPVQAPFATLGLGICYDLRFPEVARAAACTGCNLMVYPSAWVAGPGKRRQWETLLKARAIENDMFVVGVCRADEGYIGSSMVVAPDGTVVAQAEGVLDDNPKAGCEEQLLVCKINMNACERAKAAIPVLEHRRPELY